MILIFIYPRFFFGNLLQEVHLMELLMTTNHLSGTRRVKELMQAPGKLIGFVIVIESELTKFSTLLIPSMEKLVVLVSIMHLRIFRGGSIFEAGFGTNYI